MQYGSPREASPAADLVIGLFGLFQGLFTTSMRVPLYLVLFSLFLFTLLGLIAPVKALFGIDISIVPGFIAAWVFAGGKSSFRLNSANPADWAVIVAGMGTLVLVVGFAGRFVLGRLLRRTPGRKERFFALCGLALVLCFTTAISAGLTGLVKGDSLLDVFILVIQMLVIAFILSAFGLFSYSLAEIFVAGGEFIAGEGLAKAMTSWPVKIGQVQIKIG
jgi:hypothetical protein